jgi:hypothetical protein
LAPLRFAWIILTAQVKQWKEKVHGGTNAAFIFLNYTPSPEAQFPVPIEQGYAATKYVALRPRASSGKYRLMPPSRTRSAVRQSIALSY